MPALDVGREQGRAGTGQLLGLVLGGRFVRPRRFVARGPFVAARRFVRREGLVPGRLVLAGRERLRRRLVRPGAVVRGVRGFERADGRRGLEPAHTPH
ncbi:hypothetical protein DMH08_36920, partial [Actinomadura sp. WAC 06369]